MRTLLGVLPTSEDGLALSPQPGLADLEQLVGNVREAGFPVEVCIEGSTVAAAAARWTSPPTGSCRRR